MRYWLAVLALSPLLTTGGATPAPPAPNAIVIAGLLGGNTLVPLARYAAGRWATTWPRPGEEVERKLRAIEDVPRSWLAVGGGLPTEWLLWSEAMHGVPVRAEAPILGPAHCQVVWGLSTGLQPFGHETTAIATNVRLGVQPFQQSPLSSAADPRLWAFLEAESKKVEAAVVDAQGSSAPSALAHRAGDDRSYELHCVTSADAHDLCAWESSRPLEGRASEAEADCGNAVVVQGWFSRTTSAFTLLEAKATLTDCNDIELRTLVPLILIAADARSFVVVREHGYEDESFAVLEVRGIRLERALEIPGGGC